MKVFKKAAALVLSAALLFTLAGCGSGGSATDAGSNIFRVTMQDPNVPIDTNMGTQSYLIMVSDQACETLIGLNNDTTLDPQLLTQLPTVSEDGLTYSFELKDGVKFHNGETLKASDVKYSYERLITKGLMGALFDQVVGFKALEDGQATELEGFKIQDDTHFTITLQQPYAPFEAVLSAPYAVIFPEAACEEAGDNWGRTVLYGTGPFKMTEYVAGQGITMERFDDYHGEKTKLDGIEFKFQEDLNTQLMEFQKGNVDFVMMDTNQYETVQSNDEIKGNMHSFNPVGLVYLSPNNEVITDAKVREALSYAVDREAICNDLLHGAATPAKTFIPESLIGYDDSVPAYEYNPEKAKQLLAEAGYPDGITIKLTQSSKYQTLCQVGTAIQDQARAAGITLEINQVDGAAYTDMNKAGEIELSVSNWYTDYVDTDGMIYQRMSATTTQQVSNKYNNAEFNQLINDARKIKDENQRAELYKQADNILTRQDYGAIPLYNDTMFYLLGDNVENFEVTSIYRYHFWDAEFK
ncbi:MAG: ABC transporter substrate-binding protein [Eubacterium sp.]|nr:ABC transporter substrate-binding protein [Eubacterium sp.]